MVPECCQKEMKSNNVVVTKGGNRQSPRDRELPKSCNSHWHFVATDYEFRNKNISKFVHSYISIIWISPYSPFYERGELVSTDPQLCQYHVEWQWIILHKIRTSSTCKGTTEIFQISISVIRTVFSVYPRKLLLPKAC